MMKEREEFVRRITRMQLLNRKAVVVLRQKYAEKLSGADPFIVPSDGRQKPLS